MGGLRTAAKARSQAGDGAPQGTRQHFQALPGLAQEHDRVVAGELTCACVRTIPVVSCTNMRRHLLLTTGH